LKDFKNNSPCGPDLLTSVSSSFDATGAFENANHSDGARNLLQRYFIGNFVDSEIGTSNVSYLHYDASVFASMQRNISEIFVFQIFDASSMSSPFVDSQRTIALMLGLQCHSLVNSIPIDPCELTASDVISMRIFRGGLEVILWLRSISFSSEFNIFTYFIAT